MAHRESTTSPGYWEIYYQDVALVSRDGTVHSIYARGQTISLTPWSSSGVTGVGYEVNHCCDGSATPDTTTNYYHGDHLGSTRLMTSVNGYPVWSATYLPFGQEWNPQMTANHYKFTGDERDPESNLDHTLFRQYSSQFGRFSSPDPAGLAAVDPSNPQSWNRYAYVLNNPLTLFDPFGLDPCDDSTADGGCVSVSADAPDEPLGGAGGLLGGTGWGDNSPPLLTYGGGRKGGGGGGFLGALKYAANRNRCAAKYAESIASRNNVPKDNFIGQSLLGNDVATISQLALGPNRGDAALDTAFSNPTPVNAIALTAKGLVDQVAVDTGRLALSSNGAGTYFATGSILKPIAQAGIGKAVGTALGILSAAKGVFDVALYFDALVACSQDPTLQ